MDHDKDKTIFADQYNIPWNILDKRSQMITAFSNYSMRLTRFRYIDVESKNIIIGCIIYLYNEINSLKLKKVKNIKEKEEDNLISYDTAREIYQNHLKNKIDWNHDDLEKMFYFVLEMCRVSGVSDIGYFKSDPGTAIMSD